MLTALVVLAVAVAAAMVDVVLDLCWFLNQTAGYVDVHCVGDVAVGVHIVLLVF